MKALEQRTARGRPAAVVLVVATTTVGAMSGVFGLYAIAIMPGLAAVDDRTFVAAFQAIDRAIVEPWFLGFGFLGALVWSGLAALLHVRSRQPVVLGLTVLAFLLYLLAVAVTIVVHLPLNDGIVQAGNPAGIADLGAVRAAFDEARWSRWNLLRAGSATAASLCLSSALALRRLSSKAPT